MKKIYKKKQEVISAKGDVLIVVKDEATGKIVNSRFIPNLVVTVGKEFIASRMVGTSSAVMSHMGIGSNGVAPVAGDTALGSQLARVALATAVASSVDVTYTATFPAGTGTGLVTEAAIFNAATNGTMLCRTTFSAVNKTAGQSVSVTWTIHIS